MSLSSDDLWSDAARERYVTAVSRAIEALQAHARAIEGCGGPAEVGELTRTAEAVEHALGRISDAEEALTGAAAFWLESADEEPEPADDPTDVSGSDTVGVVAELELAMEVDPDELIAHAQRCSGDPTITTVEDATFAVTGALGWDAILADQVPGVEMESATAELIVGGQRAGGEQD